MITTERLILRDLTRDDLDDLARLYADPLVRRHFPDGTRTRVQTLDELSWMIDVCYAEYGFGLWATVLRDTGEFVGRCGLLPWQIDGRDEVEVAYLLDPRVWGHGLATEAAAAIVAHAFESLSIDRLICLVDPSNEASAAVARRIGMTLEQPDFVDDHGHAHLYAVGRAD